MNAYSCDILQCSGGHPEWHLQQDVRELLKKDWGGIIAFPPCTDLCASGARVFKQKRKDGRQQEAIDFFMLFANNKCKRIAIENPIGIMSSIWRKPDQIIQPYFFGDNVPKKTCLWLKNLPPLLYFEKNCLFPSQRVEPVYVIYNSKKNRSGKSRYSIFGKFGQGHGFERSKTFPGIARAMAEQWGPLFRT